MKRPDPVWEMTYKHDRRKHRHRCFCCNKILNEGDQVTMCYVQGNKTRAAHKSCADKKHGIDNSSDRLVRLGVIKGETTRDSMYVWGLISLKLKGWPVPELD